MQNLLSRTEVIDEINRGELSKIFGELFYAIDPGYRGEKGKVKTQYKILSTRRIYLQMAFLFPKMCTFLPQ